MEPLLPWGELTTAQKMQRASDYDRLSPIQRRMVHANILRRNRIEFMTRSRTPKSRPKTALQQPEPVVGAAASELPAVNRPTPSITVSPPPQPAPREPARSEVFTVAATATEVGSKLDIKHILARKTLSGATKMTTIGASQAYPRCPNLGSDGSLICPYCNDILPSDYSGSKQKSSWK
jgi:hypothetical protein